MLEISSIFFACTRSLLFLCLIKIIYVILGIELSEDTVDVLGSLATKVSDVKTHKFRRYIVIGWNYHFNVLFLIILTESKDLLRGK